MSMLLPTLASWLGLGEVDLLRLIETAPKRYKVFYVPKRSGGIREIAQPAREVKALQRVLVDQFLHNLPVHSAATAYKSGASIAHNARAHAGNGPILKMDFRDFFPSIRSSDWSAYCRDTKIFEERDIAFTENILFRKAKGEKVLKLSIGAPSSPLISNALLYKFDEIVQREADRRNINFTRYADDLTFSGQRVGMLKDMIDVVHHAMREIRTPRLQLNEQKTTFVTTANRRFVTGVVLSNSGEIGLGHSRKRTISAKVHHATLGKLDGRQLSELSGLLSFANVIEPEFLTRLETKYGVAAIDRIRRTQRVRRRGRFDTQ